MFLMNMQYSFYMKFLDLKLNKSQLLLHKLCLLFVYAEYNKLAQ